MEDTSALWHSHFEAHLFYFGTGTYISTPQIISYLRQNFSGRDQYGIRRNFRRRTNVRTFCLLKNEGSSHLP